MRISRTLPGKMSAYTTRTSVKPMLKFGDLALSPKLKNDQDLEKSKIVLDMMTEILNVRKVQTSITSEGYKPPVLQIRTKNEKESSQIFKFVQDILKKIDEQRGLGRYVLGRMTEKGRVASRPEEIEAHTAHDVSAFGRKNEELPTQFTEKAAELITQALNVHDQKRALDNQKRAIDIGLHMLAEL